MRYVNNRESAADSATRSAGTRQVIAGYRSQSEAESPLRQMKDPRAVSFSPMFHWTEHNIRVHILTCVLALQIAHLMRGQARRRQAGACQSASC